MYYFFVRDLNMYMASGVITKITRETRYNVSDQIKSLADDLGNYMCKKALVISLTVVLFINI